MIKRLFGDKQKNPQVLDSELDAVKQHISHLHHGLTQYQQQLSHWSYQINTHINQLHHKHGKLSNAHAKHKDASKAHKSEFSSLKEAIATQQKEFGRQQLSLSKLKTVLESLKGTISETFKEHNTHITTLHKEVAILKKELVDQRKFTAELRERLADVELHLTTQPEMSERAVLSQQTGQQVPKKPKIVQKHRPAAPEAPEAQKSRAKPSADVVATLTPSEKRLLALLVATQQPATYRELAEEIKKSPATVKTQLCSLKNKGIPVQEHTDDQGVKKFYLLEEIQQPV